MKNRLITALLCFCLMMILLPATMLTASVTTGNATLRIPVIFESGADFSNPAQGAFTAAIKTEPASAPPVAQGATRYEAENATLSSNAVAADDANASGGKYVESNDGDISFNNVNTDVTGYYTVTIGYKNNNEGSKINELWVNGLKEEDITFYPSEAFTTIAVTVKLSRGGNEIVIKKSWGFIDVDYIDVLHVASLPLTVSGTTVANKQYDGKTDATVTCGTVSGVMNEDEVEVTATGTFENERVGENKAVTVTYSLSGDDRGYYSAPPTETIYAAITPPPPTYTVTFHSNGGSDVSPFTGITADSLITAPTPPTKADYDFKGWYKETGEQWDFATDKVTADTHLYAKWSLRRPVLQLGIGSLTGYDRDNGYHYIYYGAYDLTDDTVGNPTSIKWRILDGKTNSGATGLFLLSEELLGTGVDGEVSFDKTEPYTNTWEDSDARSWCRDFESNCLDTKELAAILETSYTDTGNEDYAASVLNGDKVFFLSATEARNESYGLLTQNSRIAKYKGKDASWWLRSVALNTTGEAAAVNSGGSVGQHSCNYNFAARPAFNLDPAKILFTTAAVGGKSTAGMDSDLTAVPTTSSTEWKLTLKDTAKHSDFTATVQSGSVNKIEYQKAQTGANEYISAIVEDSNGNITHYGRLLQLDGTTNGASGTVEVILPFDMTGKTLYIFNEQYNDETDYASNLVSVSLTKNAYAITNHLTNISSDNTSVYRLMSDTTPYTAQLSVGTSYTLPDSITVTVGGRPLAAGTTTYEYNSASGALTIYAPSIIGDIEITAAGVAPHAHSWATAWTTNATHHWHECTAAGCPITANSAKDSYGAHRYDDAADMICNDCRYDRTPPVPTTYALTVNVNGGNGAATGGDYAEGDTVTIDAGTKANYTFAGWTSSNGGRFDNAKSASTTFTMPGNATTVTANWTANSVSITYDANGGTVTETGKTVTFDSTYGDLTTPTRFNHSFNGWFTAKDGGTEVTAATKVTNGEAHTLYAHWTEKQEIPAFTDTKTTDWFYPHMVYMYNAGLMQGTDETLFSPYKETSRGMLVAILYRLEGAPDVSGACVFGDVTAGSYYEKAIIWASANKIIFGYDKDTFGPNDDISREQLAMILFRYANYKGYDTTATADLTKFPDSEKIYSRALPAMTWAVGGGLIVGDQGNLLPKGKALRSETAAILHRFCDLYIR